MRRAHVVLASIVAAVAAWIAWRNATPARVVADDELLVVEAFTDEPVAGATVRFLARDLARDEDLFAPLDAAMSRGLPLQSDASGRVKLPPFKYHAMVCARSGALHGSAFIDTGRRPWRLELHRPAPVTIHVVDADGRACAGVGVILLSGAHRDGDGGVRARAVSNADGTTVLGDVLDHVGVDGEQTWLSVALPFVRSPRTYFDVRDRMDAPLKIALPSSGRVRCEVVDETGAAVADGATVVLRLAGNIRPNDLDERAETRATIGGVALFAWVGLGTTFDVESPSADGSRFAASQRFVGPTSAGEETRMRVTVGGRRPTAVGRLVDGKGAPVAGVRLIADIVKSEDAARTPFDTSAERAERATDALGRFAFSFGRPPGDAASAKLRIAKRVMHGRRSWSTRPISLVDLPSTLPAGEFDVGDIVFRGAAFLVSGVVVDAAGKPLAGVAVRAMEESVDDCCPIDGADTVVSDEQGRFRLLGEPTSDEVIVGASLDCRYVADRAEFARGATDARIVMLEAGGIAGSVRVPSELTGSDCQVIVGGAAAENGDAEYHVRGGVHEYVHEDGAFEFKSLRPGVARVSLWIRGKTAVLLVAEDVQVVAGEVTRDPRLKDIDIEALKRQTKRSR